MNKNFSFRLVNKHIDVRYRDVLEKKLLEFDKVHTKKNISHMLIKIVTNDKHLFCCSRGGMKNFATNYIELAHEFVKGKIYWVYLTHSHQKTQ